MKTNQIHWAYDRARDLYAEYGVDTEQVLDEMQDFQVSLPMSSARRDILWAMALIPGQHRLTLDESEAARIDDWIDWARQHRVKLDYNFNDLNLREAKGLTLASANNEERARWIDHAKLCRQTANAMGEAQRDPCHLNICVSDGSKYVPVDHYLYRQLLEASFDEVFAQRYLWVKDSIEPQPAGIDMGAAGANDFHLGYAVKHKMMVTLDTGAGLHPETMADKVSAMLCHVPGLLLHLRSAWGKTYEHVAQMDDTMLALYQEVARCGVINRVHNMLAGFDGAIEYKRACVIGARAAQRCMMRALLEPTTMLQNYEMSGRRFERLALIEHCKTLPWSAVYDEYCTRNEVALKPR